MNRLERLQRIRDIREMTERRAAGALAAARQEVAARRQIVAQLDNHRADYRERESAGQAGPMVAGDWRRQRRFLHTLDLVIDQASGQAGQQEAGIAELHAEWQRAWQSRRAMEKLSDRAGEQQRAADDRREQSALDDRAAQAKKK